MNLSSTQRAVIKRKYKITDDFKSCDFGIFVDPLNYPKKATGVKILYLHEPEPVRPDLYTKKNLGKYDYVITISKNRANRIGADEVIPQPIELPKYKINNSKRIKKVAMVNEHKFSASPRSMYGLRRKLIIECEKRAIPLDVYGKQWIEGYKLEFIRRMHALRIQFKAFRPISLKEVFSYSFHKYQRTLGLTESADCEELLQYQMSIVIENDLDYISEKIWKSLYAGSVPIYVGPLNELETEIRSAIIECEPSINSIVNILLNSTEKELVDKRKNGKKIIKNMKLIKFPDLDPTIKLLDFIDRL